MVRCRIEPRHLSFAARRTAPRESPGPCHFQAARVESEKIRMMGLDFHASIGL